MLIGSPPCSLHFQRDCFIDLSVLSPILFTHTPHHPRIYLYPPSPFPPPQKITSLCPTSCSLLLFPLTSLFFLCSLCSNIYDSPFPPFSPSVFSVPSSLYTPTSPFLPPPRAISPPTTNDCFQSPLNLFRIITVREKYPLKGFRWHSIVAILIRPFIFADACNLHASIYIKMYKCSK